MAVTWGDFELKPGATYAYIQLADWIESQIKAGRLRPGDRLPNRRDMAGYTGLSEESCSKAMGVLRDRGLAETSGRGTWVKG